MNIKPPDVVHVRFHIYNVLSIFPHINSSLFDTKRISNSKASLVLMQTDLAEVEKVLKRVPMSASGG